MVATDEDIVVETDHGVNQPVPKQQAADRSVRWSPSILLVEDSVANQRILTAMLEREGCKVVIACNGKEGVDMFKQTPFDLVFMDIQMPVMDGLEATRLIREYESHSGKHTPIIAETAGFDRESCLQAGLDDYIQKPVTVSVIRETLKRHCRLGES